MASQGDVIVSIFAQLKGFQKSIEKMQTQVENAKGELKKSAQDMNSDMDKVQEKGEQTFEDDFPGWALSIMFTAMILQRAFSNIWKSATETFNKVMSSVGDSTTQFERLSNSMTYLKFVTGQALEPIATMLIPIVDRVAEWVQHNPQLTAFGLTVTGMAGSVGFLAGQIALLNSGLSQITLPTSFLSFAARLSAIPAALWFAWKINLGNIREFVSQTVENIKNEFNQTVKNSKEVFRGFKKVIEGIFTADMDKILSGFQQIWDSSLNEFGNRFKGFATTLINVFKFAMKLMVDATFETVQTLTKVWTKFFEGVDALFDTNISDKFESANESLEKLQQQSKDRVIGDFVSREDLFGNQQATNPSQFQAMLANSRNGGVPNVQNPNITNNIQIQADSRLDLREVADNYFSGR